MKKSDEFIEHQVLVSEWKDYVSELSKKHGKKKKDKSKEVKHPRLDVKVINPEIEGLRVQDSEKNEYTIEDVSPETSSVTLSDPLGHEEIVTKTSLGGKIGRAHV